MRSKKTIRLNKVVLDVLKLHTPDLVEFGLALKSIPGVREVNVTLKEKDVDTDTVVVVLVGDFNMNEVRAKIEELDAKINSIDEVVIW